MDMEIRLEKNTYNAGETAKGTLLIRADKSLKVRKLKFSVRGKERYEENRNVINRTMYGSLFENWIEKYDVFFFEDLSPFLKSINASLDYDDSKEILQGNFAIPFHFSIPHNALESYHGRNAHIVYEVGISADMGRWKKDYHHILSFEVLNPKMTYSFGGDRFFLGEKQEKKEGKPYLGLELEMTNSISDMPKYSPSQIIKGKLKIENTEMERIKKAIIQLYGVEYPKWGRTRTISESIKKEIKYSEGKNKNDTITFEAEIPQSAKRSYSGKFSEYYWILETKVDISGRSDIHANRIIHVT
jgi:hypothetical protein